MIKNNSALREDYYTVLERISQYNEVKDCCMRVRARDESDLTDGRGQECRKGVKRGRYIYSRANAFFPD